MLLDASRGDLRRPTSSYDGDLDRPPRPATAATRTPRRARSGSTGAATADVRDGPRPRRPARNGRRAALSFASLYRVSFYAMLFFATLVAERRRRRQPVRHAYPVAVAVAAAVGVPDGRPRPRPGPSRTASLNLLAVCTFAARGRRVLASTGQPAAPGAGALAGLPPVDPDVPAQDGERGLGAVPPGPGPGDGRDGRSARATRSGFMLFAWAVLGALGARPVLAGARRLPGARVEPGVDRAGPRRRATSRTPACSNVPFLVSALRVTLTTMALGGVIFLAMPRRPSAGARPGRRGRPAAPDGVRRRGAARPARRDPRERQRRDERRAVRRRRRAGRARTGSRSGAG